MFKKKFKNTSNISTAMKRAASIRTAKLSTNVCVPCAVVPPLPLVFPLFQ